MPHYYDIDIDRLRDLYLEKRLPMDQVAEIMKVPITALRGAAQYHKIRKYPRRGTVSVGDKFSDFEVVGFKNDDQFWPICRCVCGKEKAYKRGHITAERIKSCGCRSKHHAYQTAWGDRTVSKTYWSRIVDRSVAKGVSVTVTVEYIEELFREQGGRCALSGVEIALRNWKNPVYQTASLDRIDSRLGYEPGNVQWVHMDVNFLKQEYSQDEFLEWCRRIVDHQETIRNQRKAA